MVSTTNYSIDPVEFKEFYTVTKNKDGIKKVFIQPLMLIDVLRSLGYRRMDVGEKSFIIKISDNILEVMNETKLIDQFEEYLSNWPSNFPDGVVTDVILNKLYNGLSRFFAERLLYRLNVEEDLTVQTHTQTTAYFYYRNGFVEVTADSIELKKYSELNGKIWKDQILDREFKIVEDYEECNFAKYVSNISNNWKTRWYDGEENPYRSPNRYRQFKQIIGSCLHSYTSGKMRAIVFTDSRTDDIAAGRTGKTLIMKAMGEMLNAHEYAKTFVEVNGKDFDPKDRFKWQELGVDSRLVHLNDVQINFDFSELFNDITEGIKCQRKNEMPFIVRAKLVLSTNRTIKIDGDSAEDRSLEFEMADYYCADNGPDKEFGEWFFRDWDKKAWNQFDNFMLHCTQLFLKHGIEKPETINLEMRKMKEETCAEFVDWMDYEYLKLGENEERLDILKEAFERINKDFKDAKWFTQRKFNKWVSIYSKFHPHIIEHKIRKSNGYQFLQFIICEEKKRKTTEWYE